MQHHPMRRHRSAIKTRVGIVATALALGGGAVAVVAASHGSAPAAVRSAAYDSGYGGMSEWGMLNSAISDWGSARSTSMRDLAGVTSPAYTQAMGHGKTLDMQRGVVVFASRQFFILKSKNGALHLWLLSGRTHFENVSNSMSGTMAMTASTTASQQAMDGQMVPAVNLMAGGAATAANLLRPASRPQTVTVHVAGTDLTITITITRNSATMSQTATMPASGAPMSDPTTSTMSAWSTAGMMTNLARGDLAMVVGTRSHHLLHAQIVLYTPLTTSALGNLPGGTTPAPSLTPTPVATHW